MWKWLTEQISCSQKNFISGLLSSYLKLQLKFEDANVLTSLCSIQCSDSPDPTEKDEYQQAMKQHGLGLQGSTVSIMPRSLKCKLFHPSVLETGEGVWAMICLICDSLFIVPVVALHKMRNEELWLQKENLGPAS